MIQNISLIITSLTWVYRAWDIDWVLTGPSQQDSLKLLLRSESPKSFVPYPRRQKDNTVFGAVFFSRMWQVIRICSVINQFRETVFHQDIQKQKREIRRKSDYFLHAIRGVWIANEKLSRVLGISTQSKQSLRI